MTEKLKTEQEPSTQLRLAGSEDIPVLFQVLEDARQTKLQKGDTVWGDKPFNEDEVSGMLDRGGVLVLEVDSAVAATVTITESDTRMWGEQRGSDGLALYVHKLAVGGTYAGQGLGETIMTSIDDMARDQSKPFVRLDCPADNIRLCGYYERQGFVRIDDHSDPAKRNPDHNDGTYHAALFQKEVVMREL